MQNLFYDVSAIIETSIKLHYFILKILKHSLAYITKRIFMEHILEFETYLRFYEVSAILVAETSSNLLAIKIAIYCLTN